MTSPQHRRNIGHRVAVQVFSEVLVHEAPDPGQPVEVAEGVGTVRELFRGTGITGWAFDLVHELHLRECEVVDLTSLRSLR